MLDQYGNTQMSLWRHRMNIRDELRVSFKSPNLTARQTINFLEFFKNNGFMGVSVRCPCLSENDLIDIAAI